MQRATFETTARAFLAVVVLMSVSAPWPGVLAAPAATDLRLAEREFSFVPRELIAQPGDVTFVVRNEGTIEHNFVLEDKTKKNAVTIPIIEPGQILQAKVTLPPGTYTIYCGLPGHREAGMTATLKVQ